MTQEDVVVEEPTKDKPAPDDKKDESKDVVAKNIYDRAYQDLQKAKAKAKELEDKLKAKDLEQMKQAENWKEIAELKQKEAEDASNERDTLRNSLVFDRKYAAVKDAAVRVGLRKEAEGDLEMMSLSDLQVETTSTGRVNVLGVDDYVARLKMTKPHWFETKKSKVNSDSPEVVNGNNVSYDDVNKAAKKAKETGDYAPYEKLLRQYQQSLRG